MIQQTRRKNKKGKKRRMKIRTVRRRRGVGRRIGRRKPGEEKGGDTSEKGNETST